MGDDNGDDSKTGQIESVLLNGRTAENQLTNFIF